MDNNLIEFKEDLHLDIHIGSAYENSFPEESFFEVATSKLSEAGILDNVEAALYKNSRKGIRIDGYSWNELERTFCIVIVHLSTDTVELDTLNQSEINALALRPSRFVESAINDTFLDSMDPSSPGYAAATQLRSQLDEILKFRIVVLTDYLLSDRIKSIKTNDIFSKPTTIEVWDLQRFYALDTSESDSEPFTVGQKLLGGGLPVMKGAELPDGACSYLGVMPATILSDIYDEYGQRLLEGNVRTFLDFRSGVNKGLRRTLVLEPENFFAYNNGITLTADSAKIDTFEGVCIIRSLENLQIVNGGQTTAAIYFAPREPGVVKTTEGDKPFKSIDLTKVSVQMKLTVFSDESREDADEYRSKISNYANSQNSVQDSDLVSHHPLHMIIERLSRQILMPANETGLATKWFYERTRGQYNTQLRARGAAAKKKFQIEFPKSQVFTKTEMAKYENTWRMSPNIVKKGAQANLKALGPILADEYEKNPSSFEAGFYRELIAKAILFKSVDSSVMRSTWYKEESGLKAEAVTYGIALFRHNILKNNLDINLEKIFMNQGLSSTLTEKIVDSCRIVRESITNAEFRNGTGNPSEFCKSENGWKLIQKLPVDTENIVGSDLIGLEEKQIQQKEIVEVNKVGESLSDFEKVINFGETFWVELAKFNLNFYSYSDIQVSVPTKCAQMLRGGRTISPKQMKAALRIASESENNGFEFQ